LCATDRLSCSGAASASSPSRWRQRVSDERSNGRTVERQRVTEHHLAAEELEIRVLDPACAQRLVGDVVHVLQDQKPDHQPGRQRRLAAPGPAHRAEALPDEVPVDLLRQPHQRVAQVDDLVERRAEQVVLAIVAWPAHRSLPERRILASKGITIARIRHPKLQGIRASRPPFLQKRILRNRRSLRLLNHFRKRHGRLRGRVSHA
jgi:hypothetical protein